MRPFFFGDSAEPLFGIYHPPLGPRPLPWGVVICNPFGQEYLRAHRSLHQLASRFAGAGFHVLRFDYFGCGDSAGNDDEGRLGRWLEDTAAAVAEIDALAGSSRVALVGLRLGATLALRFADRHRTVERLVLWDAVGDGRRYLDELTEVHEAWLREHAGGRPDRGAEPAKDERLGFPLPSELRAEIEAVDAASFRTCPARDALVVVTDGRAADAEPFPGSSGAGARVERARVAGPPVWLRGDAMDGALVPTDALESIAAWLSRVCR